MDTEALADDALLADVLRETFAYFNACCRGIPAGDGPGLHA